MRLVQEILDSRPRLRWGQALRGNDNMSADFAMLSVNFESGTAADSTSSPQGAKDLPGRSDLPCAQAQWNSRRLGVPHSHAPFVKRIYYELLRLRSCQ